MKPLTAYKIIPDRKSELFDVTTLFDLPNRFDKDYMDYLAIVMEDMDNRGMEWPILVIKKDNYWNRFTWQDYHKLGVFTGSNRFRYALQRGYTHIEGILVENRSDWFPLWESTFYRVKSDLTKNE